MGRLLEGKRLPIIRRAGIETTVVPLGGGAMITPGACRRPTARPTSTAVSMALLAAGQLAARLARSCWPALRGLLRS
jgi:hypothetical protein